MDYIQYLKFILQTVKDNLKPGESQLTTAALGSLLHHSSPDLNWKHFGKSSLSELLDDPWFSGKLNKSLTDKDALAVTLASNAINHIEKFNPLRKVIWDAFVLTSPQGRRFFSRAGGSVRSGLEIAPAPADDWVEIHPIDNQTQHNWAREFVESQSVQVAEIEDWTPHSFSVMLKEVDQELAVLWNRYRSAAVSKVVQQWLSENNLPTECAFQHTSHIPSHKNIQVNVDGDVLSAYSAEETRQILLSAISLLPLEDLLDIPLPPRLIFAALSKRKVR